MNKPQEKTSNRGEILAVDDSPASLAYLSELLTAEGYSVRVAPNGELAIWTASSRPPDLVLLDIRMPGMDGFQVCRRFKDNPATKGVPVIFLSAQTSVSEKVQGFQAGGVDYIEKPFSTEEILQRVATHIKLAQLTRDLEIEKIHLEERVLQRTEALEGAAKALRQEMAARNEAEAQQKLAASAFEASLSASYIADLHGKIISINPAFTQLTGYSAEESLGKTSRLLDSGKHAPDFFRAMATTLESTGKWGGEIWIRRKDTNVFPCLHTVTAVKNEHGEPVNYVGVMLDLSESKDAQTLIEFLTRHDPLTGLPNRVLVRDRFTQILGNLNDSEETLAVLCINLDRFRYLNEFHGHAAGDEVLQWVTGQILECLPSRDTIYREGGDEFYLIHRDDSRLLELPVLIEAILSRLNTETNISDTMIDVSASVGVAVYPADGKSLEELSGNAAVALARAKTQGGETYAYFTGNLDQNVRAEFDIALRLRHALDRGEFEVYYQPQNAGTSGRIVSAEALLRWRTADKGYISPAIFIPVAEDTGRIVDIGNWVIANVCRQIAAWHAEGHGWIKVAVNVSALQLLRDDLPQRVDTALKTHNVPPQYLEIEVTESAMIKDVTRAISSLQTLKAIGVTLSLDDFGTGYSSLSYLRRFPIDYLKIDQSFVRELFAEADPEPGSAPICDANAIVRSIIGMAHNLHIKVVAEGVETEAQRAYLRDNACDILQGYLFSKPVPAADFLSLFLAQLPAK